MNTKFSRRALDVLQRVGGDQLVRDVVELFRSSAPGRVRDAREALRRGDARWLARSAHALKSSAGQLGASRLAELCEEVEALAEAGAPAGAGPVVEDLDRELDEFLRTLPRMMPEGEHSVQRRLIGVVEDNEDSRLLLRKILEPYYEVAECADGDEALQTFARRVPDAVILDISLPGMDGVELLGMMRAHPRLSGVPAVALTAHAMVGDRESLLAKGFDGYASKPILDEEDLLVVVRSVLKRGA